MTRLSSSQTKWRRFRTGCGAKGKSIGHVLARCFAVGSELRKQPRARDDRCIGVVANAVGDIIRMCDLHQQWQGNQRHLICNHLEIPSIQDKITPL